MINSTFVRIKMHEMKRNMILALLLLTTMVASAKSMTEVWTTMPEQLVPFLDHNHRLEMPEFIAMGIGGEVDNQLDGKSTMDTLTTDYLHVTLTETSTLEIKRLPVAQSDSILCVVHTVGLPEGESTVEFYTQEWEPLSSPLAKLTPEQTLQQLTLRPDTMTQARYDSLCTLIDPVMTMAHLSVSDDNLTLELAQPLINEADRKAISALLRKRVVRWDGKRME